MLRANAPLRLVVLVVSLSGCYASYLRDAGEEPDAAGIADSGVDAPRDGPILIDAAPPRDAGSCPGSNGVVVRVEAVTADAMRCAVSHAEGVQVLGVEAAPADNGIRVHTDLCPGADADCRCDFVVANVGVDLADLILMPAAGNTFDIGSNHLSVSQVPTCECMGCPCSMALVLEAGDGLLGFSPHFSSEFELSAGAVVCPEPSACVSGTWMLHAQAFGTESDIPVGAELELGIVHVRSVRDVEDRKSVV